MYNCSVADYKSLQYREWDLQIPLNGSTLCSYPKGQELFWGLETLSGRYFWHTIVAKRILNSHNAKSGIKNPTQQFDTLLISEWTGWTNNHSLETSGSVSRYSIFSTLPNYNPINNSFCFLTYANTFTITIFPFCRHIIDLF